MSFGNKLKRGFAQTFVRTEEEMIEEIATALLENGQPIDDLIGGDDKFREQVVARMKEMTH